MAAIRATITFYIRSVHFPAPPFIMPVLAASRNPPASNHEVSNLIGMKVRPGALLSAQTDIGCQRVNNEDSFGYWEPEEDGEFLRKGRLAIVADGMGGYEGGQEASRLAVESVVASYRDFTGDDPQQGLVKALESAHRRIRERAAAHLEFAGMGTTCTALAIIQQSAYYAHVGDTRLYLVRGGQITQLTRDHSYVGRLVESGVLSREEAERHPQRNILTAAMGSGVELVLDWPGRPEPLQTGDLLLLCTDGLWGQVRDAEILQIVENNEPQESAGELIRLARERGGPDNITVQILELK